MNGKSAVGNIPINRWKVDERPREKLLLRGPSSLSDSELLAILLRSGDMENSAVDVSRSLLSRADNSLRKLAGFTAEKLMSISGIGPAKAATLLAVSELAIRISAEPEQDRPLIRSASAAAAILSPILKNLSHEECWVLYLNRDARLIGRERISSGGVSATVFDTRIIVKKALEKLASSIIISHNHPSGNPYPGEADRRNTSALKDAATLFEIMLVDHIIIAGDKYYSFSEDCVGQDIKSLF